MKISCIFKIKTWGKIWHWGKELLIDSGRKTRYKVYPNQLNRPKGVEKWRRLKSQPIRNGAANHLSKCNFSILPIIVYGNWPELVVVPPPPSSGQRALLNTPKTGKKCHIVWDRPLMINRRGNQFNFISSRSLGYPTGFYFPSEEEISSGSLGFMISILPRPPATRQVPTARDEGESIGLYISTWTEFSRIKSDKHGWTTKKKPYSDCDIQGHAYCLFLKIWVSGAEL